MAESGFLPSEKTRDGVEGSANYLPMYKRAICWLRRDLRLEDNTALQLACSQAREVAVVFVFDTQILAELRNKKDTRITFIHQAVTELDAGLRKAGSRLTVLHGDPVIEIPKLTKQWGAECVFASHDDDPYALSRDKTIKEELNFQTCKDHVVFERQEILNQSGSAFRVFTPYSKAWLQALGNEQIEPREADFNHLIRSNFPSTDREKFSIEDLGFQVTEPWIPGGRRAAVARLSKFQTQIDDYAESRDFPHPLKTSQLSADLRFGTISVRECVRMALTGQSKGHTKWLAEVIWRDFYHMILANFPEVATEPMNQQFKGVEWPGDPGHYEPWEQGMTGYPIVDAAMRCLNETGWMHNRLRMVVAMFFTKDLLLDYRLGEFWFAQKLLDFDLASNNGGWQWSASTGADAQPWFRIFNPITQSMKFDSDGSFIRQWCPELANLPAETIHWPSGASQFDLQACGVELGENYSRPIVDHHVQRGIALSFLENTTKRKSVG